METINVIEIVDNVVIGIESFLIEDEQLKNHIVEQAESRFRACAVENGAKEPELEYHLDDGYYTNENYGLCLTWS